MRRPFICANWKMYKTSSEVKDYFYKFLPKVKIYKDRDIVLCIPFPYLYLAKESLENTNVEYGAQNVYTEEQGAYTGEVSVLMLKDLGCKYVIIGHSERRKYFYESDSFINKKVLICLKYNLIPIVCIGETLQERESNQTFKVLEYQVKNSLCNLSFEEAEKIIIAYEPVWAIGTGKNATASQAQEAHSFIRKKYGELYTPDIAKKVRILYGGSIKPDNFKDIMTQQDVDGGLVGGSSLDPEIFYKIVSYDK